MTYPQIRRYLSAIARVGDSAPSSLFPIARWAELSRAGCVAYLGSERDAWEITDTGWEVLAQRPIRHAQPVRRQVRSA